MAKKLSMKKKNKKNKKSMKKNKLPKVKGAFPTYREPQTLREPPQLLLNIERFEKRIAELKEQKMLSDFLFDELIDNEEIDLKNLITKTQNLIDKLNISKDNRNNNSLINEIKNFLIKDILDEKEKDIIKLKNSAIRLINKSDYFKSIGKTNFYNLSLLPTESKPRSSPKLLNGTRKSKSGSGSKTTSRSFLNL
jgi:hypothetical protein